MSMEDMQPPARPVELDRLNAFVGTWEGTAEGTMGEHSFSGKGTSTATWETGGWTLVERGRFTSNDPKDKNVHEMLSVTTWDAHEKRYCSGSADNMGGLSKATMKYDEKTQTWHMKGTGQGPMGCTVEEGTVRFVDPNTMEWTWKAWDSWKINKVMEMRGTSRRVAGPPPAAPGR
jgi:hypothetical protein